MPQPDLAALVARQLRRWEIQRGEPAEAPLAPCVAISRWCGAGGSAIGRQVAEWLDYGCFDRALLEQLGADPVARERLAAGLEPAGREAAARWLVPRDPAGTRGERGAPDPLAAAMQLVALLGWRGNAVLLGCAAGFLLPPERVLRVLVVAPRARRVEETAAERGLTPEAAEAAVGAADRERRGFLEAWAGSDPDTPSRYDLVLNGEAIGREAGARIVVQALRSRFPAAAGRGR